MSNIIGIIFVFLVWLSVCIITGLIEEYNTPKISEDCYYCKYSKTPQSIRDKNKNTCKIINNKGYSSEQVRKCKYRRKIE